MTKLRHTTIKYTNYLPTDQLQGENNQNNKAEETSDRIL